MPYKGSRKHAGQAAGSLRKRRNQKDRQAALLEEAQGLKITVATLVKRKFKEWQRIGQAVARQIAEAKEAARRDREAWEAKWR